MEAEEAVESYEKGLAIFEETGKMPVFMGKGYGEEDRFLVSPVEDVGACALARRNHVAEAARHDMEYAVQPPQRAWTMYHEEPVNLPWVWRNRVERTFGG